MPKRYFSAALRGLEREHVVEYFQIDAARTFTPATEAEAGLREYEGSPEELAERVGEVDVLVLHGAPVTSRVVEAAPSLRLVGCARGGPVNVDVDALTPVDLVVTGCVAVDERGARLGKGGGFSDLELAVAAGAGLVDAGTTVVTTVHELQVVGAGTVPTTAHDLHVDVVVTPERVLRCPRPRDWALPSLDWSQLTEDKIASIPLLQRLRERGPAH